MDRELVNNQIVLMRKIVRNVKRYVYQKILKQIKVLEKKRNNKQNDKIITKLENKIANKKKELMEIKGVNVDNVSKQALLNDKSHFDDLIVKNKCDSDERAIARIAVHENVRKAVNKFKDENPNCELWLPEQIELWHQKKLMKRNKILEKKSSQNENITENGKPDKIANQLINSNKSSISEPESKKSNAKVRNKKALIKTKPIKTPIIPIDEEVVDNNAENDDILETEENTNEINIQTKSDPFFLSNDMEANDEQSDSIDVETTFNRRNKNKNSKNYSQRNGESESKFSKVNERRMKPKSRINDNKKDQNSAKLLKNDDSTQERKDKSGQNSGLKAEKVHPSWEAKRLMKEKFKVRFDQNPIAKKIKFNDN